MEFEFNFGEKTLAQGIKKNNAIYAAVTGVAFPLSHEELMFMDKQSGDNHVMTHQVLQAMSMCQNFKAIDQHVLTISQSIPELSEQTPAIQQVMDYLINKNLLIKDKDWQQKLCGNTLQNTISSAGIVIQIGQQTQQLKRLLQSLVKYQKRFNVQFPVQIYDNSDSDKIANEFEELCKEFNSELGINFYNRVWQQQFISMLKTKFPNQHDSIDWLLEKKDNSYSGGRIWNLALLNNAGKKFLYFNDDYIFEARTVGETTNLLDLKGQPDLSVGFSLSLSEIRESSNIYDTDILTTMINTCGQSVGNWLSTSQIKFKPITGLRLLDLQRINANSQIKTIGCGTWGSPRLDSNYWLYYLQGQQKQAFWKSREIYLDNIEASNLLHYSDDYEVLAISRFTPSAIDNSSMVPFAMPRNQGEEQFFTAVSLYCYPSQASLHLPIMMGHIQSGKKDISSTNHIAKTPGFNKFLADYALTLIDTTDAQNPQLRLKTLADYVLGLANSSDENTLNRLKEYLSHIRSDIVLSMQNQLSQSPDAPVYWQADVREIIESNAKALLKNDVPVLKNWSDELSEQQCIEQFRGELTDVAQAMRLWPEIWEFCKTSK